MVGLCGSLRYATDVEDQELHQTVSMFLSKGQLTRETLPLLVLWARSAIPQWSLVCIAVTCWAAISTLIVGRYAPQLSRSHLFLFLFTTLCYFSALRFYRVSVGAKETPWKTVAVSVNSSPPLFYFSLLRRTPVRRFQRSSSLVSCNASCYFPGALVVI